MSKRTPQHSSDTFSAIFAQLNQQDVEEFYAGYKYWYLQQHLENLQIRLNHTLRKILENKQRIQEVQPTAIELATLARLQSNGVSDIDLLDRMLERGESWLDRTMQRLDYFEQLDDFIRDDYTQWGQHALEGAYDWIDSVLDSNVTPQSSTTPLPITTDDVTDDVKEGDLIEATEELFLQKISTDEDEAFAQEITTKRSAIKADDLEEVKSLSEDIHTKVEVVSSPLEELQHSDEQPSSNAPSHDSKETDSHSSSTIPQTYRRHHHSHKSHNPERPNVFKRFIGRIWDR